MRVCQQVMGDSKSAYQGSRYGWLCSTSLRGTKTNFWMPWRMQSFPGRLLVKEFSRELWSRIPLTIVQTCCLYQTPLPPWKWSSLLTIFLFSTGEGPGRCLTEQTLFIIILYTLPYYTFWQQPQQAIFHLSPLLQPSPDLLVSNFNVFSLLPCSVLKITMRE